MQKEIILQLFVSGSSPTSREAILNLQAICAEIEGGHRYKTTVIDIEKNPQVAEEQKIIATPMAVKKLPESIHRIIGDLSNNEQVLAGLDIGRIKQPVGGKSAAKNNRSFLQHLAKILALYFSKLDPNNEREIFQKASSLLSEFLMRNPNPVLRIDRYGDVCTANSATQILFTEISNSDGKKALQEWQEWKELINTAKESKNNFRKKITVVDKHYLFDVIPLTGSGYVDLYGTDISSERDKEIRLHDLERNLPGAAFQYRREPNGVIKITNMNQQFFELWGVAARNEAAPLHVEEIWEKIHPDDLAEFKESLEISVEEMSLWKKEWRIITDAGEIKWLHGSGLPRKGAAGEVIWNLINLDITIQQKADADIKAVWRQTILALSAAVEAHDIFTAGHGTRVAEVAKKIGHYMELDYNRVEGLELAALVHDIGKLSIPASILSKPGELTEVEYQLLREHSRTGANIMEGIDFPWPIADSIKHRHERWDGSGYPCGLERDETILEARIIGVADALEAMVSNRPYRPGIGIDAAIDKILQSAGTSYDPRVAAAYVSLVKSGEITL